MKRVWLIVVLMGLLMVPTLARGEDVAEESPESLGDVAAVAAADMEHDEAVAVYQESLKVRAPGRNWSIALVCLAGALVVAGGSFAIAMISKSCIESMARQPEASGAMFGPMIITAAMIEGAMLFAIITGLLAVMARL
jgi:F-type H+-transporting ATPase subunit c